MNQNRRYKLDEAIIFLKKGEGILSAALSEEEECLNSLPENMESGNKYQKMEQAVENLNEALAAVGSAIESITEAKM